MDFQTQAWENIAESYNELQTSGNRSVNQLKLCKENLFKKAKLDINKEKVNINISFMVFNAFIYTIIILYSSSERNLQNWRWAS